MEQSQITILGVGSILMTDEGFGVRVIQALDRRFDFPENVSVVDGGVLGLNLLSVMAEADHLIVIDAIRNHGAPGDLFRLSGDAVPERIRAKNSLHQVDFLETFTLCQVMEKVPETVILGVQPMDIDTLSVDLTDVVRGQIDPVIDMVLAELDRLGIAYAKKPAADDSGEID
ncbi:MAG: HyaD/HybD family hydrogenase maturation endopeptidase [Desulfobacterales bacterium]|nr:HyaD/HybD family hydrogenase maturation endopeptidase [Desulfobacterales bacterium]MBS3755095.1 HyaD/HybD family hydrogenase maturation endopeptidase [Desulfobacterales bacterium]